MNGETSMGAEPQRKAFPESGASIVVREQAIEWQDGVIELPQRFPLDAGTELINARLAWQCTGPAGAPLIIVLGGISAHRRVCAADGTGWWEEQVGAGRTLDTRHYRVLGIDWLGGCDESTGPRSDETSPSCAARPSLPPPRAAGEGTGWGQEFPVISTADQARALLILLNRFGVRRVHLLVGASYGGNVAQQLAALLGDRVRHLVLLSAAHRPAQFGLALRQIQRSILDLGGENPQALALARELAVLCYRTPEGIEQRFAGDDSRAGQEPKCLEGQGWPGKAAGQEPKCLESHGWPGKTGGVVGWLRHHGEKFRTRFDAAAYRCLGRSLDGHFVDPAVVRVPTTVFAVREDLTVPLSLLHDYAARAGGQCHLVEISSVHGHDAFLKETGAVSHVLAAALEAAP